MKPCYYILENQPKKINKNTNSYPYSFSNSGYPIQTILSAYDIKPSERSDITVGIIELGGGYLVSDLEACMTANGFPNWKASEHVFPYFIDEYPTNIEKNFYNDLKSSGEVTLDIEIVSNTIPNGRINVYFAPKNDESFCNAILQAITDKCTTISISWGSPEVSTPTNNIFNFIDVTKKASELGISIFVATGDSGVNTQYNSSSNNTTGYNVGFPASSPYVIACGGTNLSLRLKDGQYKQYSKETSWIEVLNEGIGAGNGGESIYFNKPCYQKKLKTCKRTIPDISGNASVYNGWIIYINGNKINVGGTSAVAPMWAGYTAGLGCNVFLNCHLYKINRNNFHDIVAGIDFPYRAKYGYDLCTGLGSPNGKNLTPTLLKIFEEKKQKLLQTEKCDETTKK